MPTNVCHLCKSRQLRCLIDFGEHPVSKHYLLDASETPPKWPVRLYFCEACGMTQLVDSVPPEIIYDNYVTLSSWKRQPQVAAQIETLKRLDGLGPDSRIVEIGCNDGMFLSALEDAGFRNLVGIEPAQDAAAAASAKGFAIVREFLTPAVSREMVSNGGQFDLLISRQNFEHIEDLAEVVDSIKVLLKPGGFVLVELPNYEYNMKTLDYSLWEEHVNYFTPETLRYFLSLAGIEPIIDERIIFCGECLVVFGKNVGCPPANLDYMADLRARNIAYADAWPSFSRALRDDLMGRKAAGQEIALYGAASRAFCLVNYAGLAPYIDLILDDQREKQNQFTPEGGIPIVAGDTLYERKIDLCLLTVSSENEETVMNKHASWSRGGGEFKSLFPPSPRLLPAWSALNEGL